MVFCFFLEQVWLATLDFNFLYLIVLFDELFGESWRVFFFFQIMPYLCWFLSALFIMMDGILTEILRVRGCIYIYS
jgi:hypothetical protein